MFFLALGAVLAIAPAVSLRTESCDLDAVQTAWVQTAVDGWERASREFLRLDPEPFPWTILIGRTCAWHIAGDPNHLTEAAQAPLGLRLAGRPLDVRAHPHTGTIALPSGRTLPPAPTAFAAAYDNADGATTPFFVLALPEVWRQDPKAAAEPRLDAIILGVLSHEVMHTRQIVDVSRRADALKAQYTLPDALDDDLIERRFRDVPGFAEAVEAETALIYRAANATDPAEQRRLAREALGLVDARHARYFTGDNAGFAAVEGMFLNMEAVAVWTAYRLSRVDARFDIGIKDPGNRERSSWSQDEGFGLMLLIDALVPDWRARMLGPDVASPFEVLRQALASPRLI